MSATCTARDDSQLAFPTEDDEADTSTRGWRYSEAGERRVQELTLRATAHADFPALHPQARCADRGSSGPVSGENSMKLNTSGENSA